MPGTIADIAKDEVQTVELTDGPTSGTWTLTFVDPDLAGVETTQTTGALANDISAADLKAALIATDASYTADDFVVSRTGTGPNPPDPLDPYVYEIIFRGALSEVDIDTMTSSGASLRASTITHATSPGGTAEIQTFKFGKARVVPDPTDPDGGTFTLTAGAGAYGAGGTTGAIAYNATDATVQTALDGITSAGYGAVTKVGQGSYSITFTGEMPQLTSSGASLTRAYPIDHDTTIPGVAPVNEVQTIDLGDVSELVNEVQSLDLADITGLVTEVQSLDLADITGLVNEIQTMDLGGADPVSNSDTYKIALGAGGTNKTALLTYTDANAGVDHAAQIQAAIRLVAGYEAATCTAVDANTFTITMVGVANPDQAQVTDATGFTPDTPDATGFATNTPYAAADTYKLALGAGGTNKTGVLTYTSANAGVDHAAQIQAAIRLVAGYEAVTVAAVDANTFTITMVGVANPDQAQVTDITGGFTPTVPDATGVSTTTPYDAADTYKLALGAGGTNKTGVLTYTSANAGVDHAAEIQAAIRLVAGYEAVTVTAVDANTFTITMVGVANPDQAQVTDITGGFTPTVPDATGVSTTTPYVAADTYKIAMGAGGTNKTGVLTYTSANAGVDHAAEIQAAIRLVAGFEATTATAVDANTFTITFLGAKAATDVDQMQITDTATFTPKADEGYTTGVITTTPGVPRTNEVQTVRFGTGRAVPDESDPTGGTFTLTFTGGPQGGGGHVSAGIAYNASAATVEAAMDSITEANYASVAKTAQGHYVITFDGANAAGDMAQLTSSYAGLTRSFTIDHATSTPSVNEIQTVELTDGPTGGTFTLSFSKGGAQTTTAIDFDATAQEVEDALVALSNIDTDGVSVGLTGAGTQDDPSIYTIEFVGTMGGENVPQLTSSGANLTASTITHDTTVTGGTSTSPDPSTTVGTITTVDTSGGAGNYVADIKLEPLTVSTNYVRSRNLFK